MAKRIVTRGADAGQSDWLRSYNKIGGGSPDGYLTRLDLSEQAKHKPAGAGAAEWAQATRRERRPVLLPPAGNTGGSLHGSGCERTPGRVYVHLDYYRASVWADAEQVLEGLRGVFGWGLADWMTAGRGRFFEHAKQHTSGAVLRYGAIGGGGHCSLELSGEACERLAWGLGHHARLWDLCRVNGWRVRLTRLDIALDGALFGPAELRERFGAGMAAKAALRASGGRAGRKNDSLPIVTELRADSWQWFESAAGRTVYLGSRQSDRMLRCYDKRGYTRVELELKGGVASELGELLSCGGDLDSIGRGLLRDLVDFPDWAEWQAVIGGAGAVHVVVKPRVLSFERARSWFYNAVLPTLDALVAATGNPDFARHLSQGDTRCRSKAQILRHQMIVATAPAF